MGRLRKATYAGVILLLLPWAFIRRRLFFRVNDSSRQTATRLSVGQASCIPRRCREASVAAAFLIRWLPYSVNCLTIAIATGWLLWMLGEPSVIRIGVRFVNAGEFQSHAWLIVRGRPVTGGPLEQGYSTIWTSGGES